MVESKDLLPRSLSLWRGSFSLMVSRSRWFLPDSQVVATNLKIKNSLEDQDLCVASLSQHGGDVGL
ncbi:hypothetical protein QJS10_CPA07g00875 [Acorus calamus]|uniref:Uncharacterized protein n=1 Tax=Acorus calamus TaxID=4465 RepID=A0AAV9EJR3_ACOCL|nr:hypothetical protein QJS10_CPA07g00875 [Acorus calamus]